MALPTTGRFYLLSCHNFLSQIWMNIRMFPKIGVPRNGRFIMEHLIKMDDLGVPLFSETSIPFPNQHIGKEIFHPKYLSKVSRVKPGEGKWISWLRGGILHRQKRKTSSPVRECFTAPTPNVHAYAQKIHQIRLKLTATKAFSWKNSRIFCLEFWMDIFWGAKNPLRFSDSTWLPWWNVDEAPQGGLSYLSFEP